MTLRLREENADGRAPRTPGFAMIQLHRCGAEFQGKPVPRKRSHVVCSTLIEESNIATKCGGLSRKSSQPAEIAKVVATEKWAALPLAVLDRINATRS